MRFCDLFVEYKIMLDSLSKRKPWKSLPLTKKVALMFLFLILLMNLLSTILLIGYKITVFYIITLSISLVIAIIFLVYQLVSFCKKNEIKKRLIEIDKPYSKKRMNALVQLLRRYSIDPSDEEVLKQLIDLAGEEKARNYPSISKVKPFVAVTTSFSAASLSIFSGIIDKTSQQDLIRLGIMFVTFIIPISALVYAISQIVEWIIPGNKRLYEDFQNDVKQLIVFGIDKK